MADQPGKGFDPQQSSSSGQQGQPQQQGQQGQEPDDQELTDYLQKEEGHTESSAKQELKNNKEGVKARHKKHKEKHGSGSSSQGR